MHDKTCQTFVRLLHTLLLAYDTVGRRGGLSLVTLAICRTSHLSSSIVFVTSHLSLSFVRLDFVRLLFLRFGSRTVFGSRTHIFAQLAELGLTIILQAELERWNDYRLESQQIGCDSNRTRLESRSKKSNSIENIELEAGNTKLNRCHPSKSYSNWKQEFRN